MSATFGAMLRQLRVEAGLTQEELAEAARLSPRSVSDLERGIHLTARKDTARLHRVSGDLAQAEGCHQQALELGTTPYRWLLRERVQLAQRLLEMSELPIDSVAEKSGFSTAANLRKHFSRAVHTSPQAYRRTFQDRRAS